MSNFIKKFFQFSIGPVVGAFIGLITVPITTYFIVPEEYGKASMFVLVQSLMTAFLYLGLDQAYTREFNEEDDKTNLLFNAMILPVLFSILLSLTLFINNDFFSALLFEDGSYKTAINLLAIMPFFIVIERFILLTVRMEEKALEYSLYNIFFKIVTLITTITFVFFIRRDFLAIVYSIGLGQIIGDIFLLVKYKGIFKFSKFTIKTDLLKKLLLFGFPLIFSVGIGSILSSFDKIALRSWSDFEQLGIYVASFKIVNILLIIQTSFTSFWLPVAYRWHSEKKSMEHFKLVSESLLFIMSLGFILLLCFKGIIVWILSPNYNEAQYIIGFLSFYPIMYTLSETTTLGIVFSRKSYLNIIVSIVSIIPNILLNIFLVPRYGALGAAVGTGTSYIVFFLARTFLSFKLWEGFSIKKHIFVSIGLLALAIINIGESPIVLLINIVSIGILIMFNRNLLTMGWNNINLHYNKRKKINGR